MESSQVDDASLKVTPLQSQIFLSGLRIHSLYACTPLSFSTSSFLSNDVGLGDALTGRRQEKDS